MIDWVPHPCRVFVFAARVGFARAPRRTINWVPHPCRVFVFAARVGFATSSGAWRLGRKDFQLFDPRRRGKQLFRLGEKRLGNLAG